MLTSEPVPIILREKGSGTERPDRVRPQEVWDRAQGHHGAELFRGYQAGSGGEPRGGRAVQECDRGRDQEQET
ncbi:MAG: hypothetical protein MZU79_09115 [Anaerotruncus sp.]|nr:hypothetical protein [Anaerotruncus sp.]